MQQNGHIALVFECRAASMAKSEHLRQLASRMLLVAKRTKDPAIAKSLSMQAGDLLAQAQDVELIRTVEGRAVVAKIFATSTTLREGAYTGEWKLDDRRTLLRWKGKIQGHELESFDIIEENDEELIVDRTIAFRPMPAAKLFRDAMRAAMGSSIPDDFWEYSN